MELRKVCVLGFTGVPEPRLDWYGCEGEYVEEVLPDFNNKT